MSALAKPTYTRKVTFEKLLNELSQDDKKAEKELISILVKYSSSPFSDDSWIFDRHSDKAHPDSISFKSFEIMGEMGKYIAKLFMVANLTRGGGIDSVKVLKYYYKFLSENRLNLHQVNKNIFNHYSHSFDTRISKHTKNLLSESYKFQLLSSALQFHSIMNGHPYMAFIDGVDSIENPYDRKSKDSQYKVVDKDVLEKLDAHFNTEKSPLHIRVAYWIMRLYATRPEDTLNYPLECVKTLTEDMATIKHAIVKNSINQGETQYKIGFINTKEPMQKMLFELICKQQIASSSLQIKSKKQNFLGNYIQFYTK